MRTDKMANTVTNVHCCTNTEQTWPIDQDFGWCVSYQCGCGEVVFVSEVQKVTR